MIPIFVVNPFGASSLAACKHIKKFCASSDHHYKHANVINMVRVGVTDAFALGIHYICLLYTSPSPRDATLSRMPSSA